MPDAKLIAITEAKDREVVHFGEGKRYGKNVAFLGSVMPCHLNHGAEANVFRLVWVCAIFVKPVKGKLLPTWNLPAIVLRYNGDNTLIGE